MREYGDLYFYGECILKGLQAASAIHLHQRETKKNHAGSRKVMKSHWQLWFLVTFKGIWNSTVFVFEEAGDLENFRTILNFSIHHIYTRTSMKGTLLDTLMKFL